MIQENNIKLNITDYIKWVFDTNEGTVSQCQDLSKSCVFLPGDKMKDNYKNSIIWLFRKPTTKEELDGQYEMITKYFLNVRHIFLFLLTIIHYNIGQFTEIIALMKSIGLINRKSKLVFTLETESSISKQSFCSREIREQLNINRQDYEQLIKCWAKIKEEQYQHLLNNLDQNYQLNILISTINLQFNLKQQKVFEEREKQKRREKQKKREAIEEKSKLVMQKQLSSIQIMQSQPKIIQITTKKVSYQKQKQQLMALPNGNIIKSKLWQNKNFPALSMEYRTQIIQFKKSQFTLNHLFSEHDIILYIGQVDEFYWPNSNGKMNDKDRNIIYQGGFKNGLFNGKGEIIIQKQLHYQGNFKNGQKHGMFFRLIEQRNQPLNIYLKGEYCQDKRQGIFDEYILDGQQFVKFGNKQYKYFNGQQVKFDIDVMTISIKKVNPSISLFSFGEFGVNNFLLASLQPGRWINSNIIDIIIQYCLNLQSEINPQIFDDNLFINCSLFQDLFGSIVVENGEINYNKFQEILKEKNQEPQQIKRIFFYFNLDRGHFLSVVYENSKLYLIDSQTDPRGALLHQIKKLLKKFQIQVQDNWENNFEVSQQENGYDCGIFAIYYMSQMIKYINDKDMMKKKKLFQVSRAEINLFRYKINQFFLGNGTAELGM